MDLRNETEAAPVVHEENPLVNGDGHGLPLDGYLPPMVSYAQNFEDVLLRRALFDIEKGFYLDIGAFDPVIDSVTNWFYAQGWRGINVEPQPEFHRRLMAARPRDQNLPFAVAATRGTVSLHLMDGLSTIVDEVVHYHATMGRDVGNSIKVDAITLDDIFEQHVGERTVDFLKIDVEGAEGPIITSCDFKSVRPRIIVIEATKPDSRELASLEDCDADLVQKGYTFVWFDGLNRFYVRNEDRWRGNLLAMPPNPFDSFLIHALDRRVTLAGLPAEACSGSGVADLLNERDDLTARRAEAEAKLDDARRELDDARRELGILVEECARLSTDCDQKAVEIARLQTKCRALQDECGALSEAAKDRHDLDRAVKGLRNEVEALKVREASLYASTSWRVTAPLRTVRKLLSRS